MIKKVSKNFSMFIILVFIFIFIGCGVGGEYNHGTPKGGRDQPLDDSDGSLHVEKCRSHFTGGIMTDTYRFYTSSEAFTEDWMSEYVGEGEYPDNNLAFPKAVDASFDGIAIDEGTKVTIYSGKNFTGQILLEKIGPAIINNIKWQNDSRLAPMINSEWEEPLQSIFPYYTRKWSISDMHQWSNGSLKIECGFEQENILRY